MLCRPRYVVCSLLIQICITPNKRLLPTLLPSPTAPQPPVHSHTPQIVNSSKAAAPYFWSLSLQISEYNLAHSRCSANRPLTSAQEIGRAGMSLADSEDWPLTHYSVPLSKSLYLSGLHFLAHKLCKKQRVRTGQ